MCGIAGVLNLSLTEIPNLERRLEAMNQLLRHRGPDGEGAWQHERRSVGLAHRRLSIIDLATGDQPMTDAAGNWITYNGEVYNYIELREELGAENFQTTSDTEVVLAAYRRWGKIASRTCAACLRSLCGTKRGRNYFVRATGSG
jgi:asparagine synthase (glutamine-hydrolysing)